MKNVTITEISGSDVDFDQTIDSDKVTAAAGGIAVNGDVEDSVLFSGRNEGVIAGDDAHLEDTVVGDGNTQINDSTVGAFAGRGNATNIDAQNVALGGDVTDIDTDGGDAQLVNGNGNRVTGDVDIDASGAQGPLNATFGDGNSSSALQDNSTTVEDSFNTDNSVEDSFNTTLEGSFNESHQSTTTEVLDIDDSFNSETDLTSLTKLEFSESFEDNSVVEDNDFFQVELDAHDLDLDLDLFEQDVEIQI